MSLFAKYVPFKCELESYIEKCKTIFEEIGDHTSATLVNGFIKDLENQRYNITIIGSLKRGKSTLLNTLMERNDDAISPISSNVCTSAIIKYIDKSLATSGDNTEKAVVHFNNGTPAATIPLMCLKEYVTESQNPGNRKNVHSLEVFGDFPAWSKAVTIIDSPGQNSVFGHHDTLLADFLPYTDAIIFLVAADIPLDGGDIALLKELSENQKRKIFFALTKVDNIDNPSDLQDVIDYASSKIREIGLPCDKLYSISAKPVYEALASGKSGVELEKLKSQHGITELENDLESFIVAESDQTKTLRSRIEMLMKSTSESCNNYIATSEVILANQKFNLVALRTEEMELMDANKLLQNGAKKALKKFGQSWDRALSGFQRKFANKAGAVEEQIVDRLDKGGLIGAAFQSFKLKKQVQKAVTAELQVLILDLEEKLSTVITELNSELDDEISLYVKRKSNTDILTPAGTIVTAGALGGTIVGGYTFASGSVTAAFTALSAWQGAAATAATATAGNTVMQHGIGSTIWGSFTGWGEAAAGAKAAATAAASAANAGTTAITAGVTAVATAGASIVATLIVQKILHIGLVKFQEGRVPGIAEKIMEEMEGQLFKSLDIYKDSLIKEYEQYIDDMVSDNTERLDEVKELISGDNSAERTLLAARVENVKKLISDGTQVQRQIPTLL